MSTDFKIESIGQVAIAVSNINRAIDFYRDKLGLELLFRAEPGMAFFDCGGVRLMLSILVGEPQDHHSSTVYYKVPDIHVATERLKSRGVKFVRDPQLAARLDDHEIWNAFLRDPDGNLLALTSEVAQSG
jgi:methylmalonyl-CoA/ethylmalonyl-CoA epimerase